MGMIKYMAYKKIITLLSLLCFFDLSLLAAKEVVLNHYGNDWKPTIGEVIDFSSPEEKRPDTVYLDGKWLGFYSSIESASDGTITIKTDAMTIKGLFSNLDDPIDIQAEVNGAPLALTGRGEDIREKNRITFFTVDEKRWYTILSQGDPEMKTVVLKVPSGMHVYRFLMVTPDN